MAGLLGGVLVAAGSAWAPAAEVSEEVVFALVGDTGGVGLLNSPGNGVDAVEHLSRLFDGSETLILNLECVLQGDDAPLNRCRTHSHQSAFRAQLAFADALTPTGSTIVTMANNHVLDCGAEGVLETMDELARREILTVGAGASMGEACRPLERVIGGLEVKIAAYLVMGPNMYSAGPRSAGAASWERCAPLETLRRLKEGNDLVIVSLHFHLDRGWTRTAPEENLKIVEAALDAGADVVVGHGPHVPQGIVTRAGGIGLLSLGNFIFGTGYEMKPEALESVMAKLRVLNGSLELELVPLVLDDDGWPHAASSEEAGEILRHVERTSLEMGTRLEVTNGRASLRVDRVGRVTPSSGP